ncbi:MAG TPA: ATP-dependent sacrificial sulfur transferase LarE [Myxococcales bacterium]|nr:ATP-dependent sacrificial sulfur transferase LarE [Myxococcales bacterium]HIL02678.1 ATP-dependent sacrificial sulfur transferase LarE [Myxococcales bacterium]
MPGLTSELQDKENALVEDLRGRGRLLVAFSGGVDSSYLAWASRQALGKDFLAVTAVSPSYPASHRVMAEQIVRDFDIPHRFVSTHEMESIEYRRNAPDRCYHCKSELFSRMDELLDELGFEALAYGINSDDQGDFRPGHKAAEEHRVLSPLLAAGLSKPEIRTLSKRAGLPCWDLPASACLASRLPYGTEVTAERLSQVDRGESLLREMGLRQVRLRHHGEIARIEIDPAECQEGISPEWMRKITQAIKPLGFKWVCLDLEGYRMGSLNEALSNETLSNEALSDQALRNPLAGTLLDGESSDENSSGYESARHSVQVDFDLPVLPRAK